MKMPVLLGAAALLLSSCATARAEDDATLI